MGNHLLFSLLGKLEMLSRLALLPHSSLTPPAQIHKDAHEKPRAFWVGHCVPKGPNMSHPKPGYLPNRPIIIL